MKLRDLPRTTVYPSLRAREILTPGGSSTVFNRALEIHAWLIAHYLPGIKSKFTEAELSEIRRAVDKPPPTDTHPRDYLLHLQGVQSLPVELQERIRALEIGEAITLMHYLF